MSHPQHARYVAAPRILVDCQCGGSGPACPNVVGSWLTWSGFDSAAGDVESGDGCQVAAGSDGDLLFAVEDACGTYTGELVSAEGLGQLPMRALSAMACIRTEQADRDGLQPEQRGHSWSR